MGKFSFSFSPKVSTLLKIATKQTISKTNLTLLAIDTTVSLIEAGCAYIRYSEAKKQTQELRNQSRIQKDMIDAVVEERMIQMESEFQLKAQQLLNEFNAQRRILRLNAEKIRMEISKKMQTDIQDSELWLKNLDIKQLAINPIKKTLDLYANLLLLYDAHKSNYKEFAELEEQYRLCLQKYKMLVDQTI